MQIELQQSVDQADRQRQDAQSQELQIYRDAHSFCIKPGRLPVEMHSSNSPRELLARARPTLRWVCLQCVEAQQQLHLPLLSFYWLFPGFQGPRFQVMTPFQSVLTGTGNNFWPVTIKTEPNCGLSGGGRNYGSCLHLPQRMRTFT